MKKKLFVILGIFIIILLFVTYLLYNYDKSVRIAKEWNRQYESYYQKEILGNDLATLMNKAMNSNAKNEIQQDEKGHYIDDEQNSISIIISFIGLDKKERKVKMEDILKQEMENFIRYYASFSFQCTKIEYHEKTKKVKSLYFEQIPNWF